MSTVERSPLPRSYSLLHGHRAGSLPHSPSLSYGAGAMGHEGDDDDDPFASDEEDEDESQWVETGGPGGDGSAAVSTSATVAAAPTVAEQEWGDDDGDDALVGCLPARLVRDTLRPRALEYLTRGLTSRIYTYALPVGGGAHTTALTQRLRSYGADEGKLVVKCVDLEDQGRPHDVQKEVDILTRIHDQASEDSRSRHILKILAHAVDEPDAFTTTQRVFFPFYPATLADVLARDARALVEAGSDCLGDSDVSIRVGVAHTLARQLFDALAFLHECGIVHRDVKPGNLLLTSGADAFDLLSAGRSAPPDFQLKLCDFGTAFTTTTTTEVQPPRPKTCSTSTHPYTPPELLFAPEGGYDGPAVDVWEAACVVVEMFTEGFEEEVGGKVGPDEDEDEEDAEEDAGAGTGANMLVPGAAGGGGGGDGDADMSFDSAVSGPASVLSDGEDWRALERDVFAEPSWGARTFKYVRPRLFSHRPLFDGSCGDLRLASDIFAFTGLPPADEEGEKEWPEAVRFHPPLRRMPFRRGAPPAQPEELQRRAGLLGRAVSGGGSSEETRRKAEELQDAILHCLRLSAGKRASAEEVVGKLRAGEGQGR